MKPILDRILLRKIEEKQEGDVIIPDQFKESHQFEVVAIPEFPIVFTANGPVPFVGLEDIIAAGDIVLVGQYNLEQVEVDGEKLYLTRIYDVRGHERVVSRARAAA